MDLEINLLSIFSWMMPWRQAWCPGSRDLSDLSRSASWFLTQGQGQRCLCCRDPVCAWQEVAVLMCGLQRKVSGRGVRNWKWRLPMTTFPPEEASATHIGRGTYSVQLCVERWAKEMTKDRRKRHVYYIYSYIFEFHRENTNSYLVLSMYYVPGTLHTWSLYRDSYLTGR